MTMTKATSAPTFIFAWARKNFSLPTRKKMPGQGERPPPAAGMTFATVPKLIISFKNLNTMSRKISLIVIHCSATRCNRNYTVQQLYHDHVEVNHWRFIGYHYYIRRNGRIEETRPLERMGAHAKGYNAHSIGICYEGGLDEQGRPADTRTPEQKKAMATLIVQLKQQFPAIATVLGHCDLPGVQKACPCFDATALQPLLQVKRLEDLDRVFLKEEGGEQ